LYVGFSNLRIGTIKPLLRHCKKFDFSHQIHSQESGKGRTETRPERELAAVRQITKGEQPPLRVFHVLRIDLHGDFMKNIAYMVGHVVGQTQVRLKVAHFTNF
jgi:hypothetical protein